MEHSALSAQASLEPTQLRKRQHSDVGCIDVDACSGAGGKAYVDGARRLSTHQRKRYAASSGAEGVGTAITTVGHGSARCGPEEHRPNGSANKDLHNDGSDGKTTTIGGTVKGQLSAWPGSMPQQRTPWDWTAPSLENPEGTVPLHVTSEPRQLQDFPTVVHFVPKSSSPTGTVIKTASNSSDAELPSVPAFPGEPLGSARAASEHQSWQAQSVPPGVILRPDDPNVQLRPLHSGYPHPPMHVCLGRGDGGGAGVMRQPWSSASTPMQCLPEAMYFRDPWASLQSRSHLPEMEPSCSPTSTIASSPRLSSSCPAVTEQPAAAAPQQLPEPARPAQAALPLVRFSGPLCAAASAAAAATTTTQPALPLPQSYTAVWRPLHAAPGDSAHRAVPFRQAGAYDGQQRQPQQQECWHPGAPRPLFPTTGGSQGCPPVSGAVDAGRRHAPRVYGSGSVVAGGMSGSGWQTQRPGAPLTASNAASATDSDAGPHPAVVLGMVYRAFLYDEGGDGGKDIAAVTAREGAGSWVVSTLVDVADTERMQRWLSARVR